MVLVGPLAHVPPRFAEDGGGRHDVDAIDAGQVHSRHAEQRFAHVKLRGIALLASAPSLAGLLRQIGSRAAVGPLLEVLLQALIAFGHLLLAKFVAILFLLEHKQQVFLLVPLQAARDLFCARRLLRRFLAGELILSFVPDPEQRAWRTLTRMKTRLARHRARLYSQVEDMLEEMRIKLCWVLSDLFGASGLGILQALAKGETDPKKLAALGDDRLKCTDEQLLDALTGNPQATHREMLGLYLDQLQW